MGDNQTCEFRIRGQASEGVIVVGVCYRPPNEKTKKVFKEHRSQSSKSQFAWVTTAARKLE